MKKSDWWKHAVVYQIYPKSFQDSNGDGIGDLKGIISRLDYLKRLGVNVLWLCPVYQSPMDDGGYDISDYYHIHPMFGDDADMDELIRKADGMGIKILMDLVVNHTSDEHEWFQQALKDPDSKYADYYIFKETADGNPPNNWRSYFGEPAWTRVEGTNRFYLHEFSRKQPDLNWENEALREEIYRMVNYWLDKGLAGFRIDAIGNIKKRLEYETFQPDGEDGLRYIGDWVLNQPGIEVFLQELNERTFRPHNSMTVAEANVPEELLNLFIGEEGFFSMVFDFSYTDIDVPATGEWFRPRDFTVEELRKAIFSSQRMVQEKGWGALYLENHDQNRSVNKYIPEEEIGYHSKTMLASLFFFLRGTPFIYQGQEIGMENIRMASIDDYDDIATRGQYARAMNAGLDKETAFDIVAKRSRDNSRTPMQWDSGKNAGFSSADRTWIRVNPNYKSINAADQEHPDSVLSFYRELIRLRKDSKYSDIIISGEFLPYESEDPCVIAYQRSTAHERLLVIHNFQNRQSAIRLPKGHLKTVTGNFPDNHTQKDTPQRLYRLLPYECIALYMNE
ncbi:MAG: alpha-glucosidase [Dorea sp.]|nr:alpha-glucosidase [Dorea sp.]